MKKILFSVIMRLIHWILFLYLLTLKVRIIDKRAKGTLTSHKAKGTIFVLWHDSLLLLPLLKDAFLSNSQQTVHILISQSRDGDFPAALVKRYRNYSSLRVAHNARAAALRTIIDLLSQGDNIILTPDGPRGPRRSAKSGAWYAAKSAQASITPLSVSWKKALSLPTWDKFSIPYPFTQGEIIIHEEISKDFISISSAEEVQSLLQKLLNNNHSDTSC